MVDAAAWPRAPRAGRAAAISSPIVAARGRRPGRRARPRVTRPIARPPRARRGCGRSGSAPWPLPARRPAAGAACRRRRGSPRGGPRAGRASRARTRRGCRTRARAPARRRARCPRSRRSSASAGGQPRRRAAPRARTRPAAGPALGLELLDVRARPRTPARRCRSRPRRERRPASAASSVRQRLVELVEQRRRVTRLSGGLTSVSRATVPELQLDEAAHEPTPPRSRRRGPSGPSA